MHDFTAGVGRLMMGSTPMRMAVVSCCLWVTLAVSTVAQNTPAPQFDMASIKPSPDPFTLPVVRATTGTLDPDGRWIAAQATLSGLVRNAYPGFDAPGQLVGPEWVFNDRFDIVAKAASRDPDALRQMARALLADRFALETHVESRELAVYALVLARSGGTLGPGVAPPAIDCDEYRATRARGEPGPPEVVRPNGQRIQYRYRLNCVAVLGPVGAPDGGLMLAAGGTPFSGITGLLARQLGRPVVDRTGVTKPFDMEVTFRAQAPGGWPAVSVPGDDLPYLFEALQQQAGLKLESTRAPVEVLVIDRVERPSPD